MPILQDDIKLMASERLTDNEDGGGRITGNQVQDGASNNLFPDVSDLDRVYGRVNLRKAFLSVETDDTDVYYGSHIILSERPSDPKIGVTMFSTGEAADERANAQQRLESYVVRGPESDYVLLGDQLSGQRMITCFASTTTQSPDVGDVYMLSKETDGVVDAYQYVRLTAVSYEDREFEHASYGKYTRRVFTLELSDALRESFPGAESTYWYWAENHGAETLVRNTQVADASRYYGVSKLVEPVATGDLEMRVDSIYSQLVPSATTETPVVDVLAGATAAFYMPLQDEPIERTYSISSNAHTTELGVSIMPGSLDIYNGAYVDDGAGVLMRGSEAVGSVDYNAGTVSFNYSYNGGNTNYRYVPVARVQQAAHTYAEDITLSNRGFNYVNSLIPIPVAGTLTVDYMAQGRWYRLMDDGNGNLSDSVGGSGTINFDTGSVMVTLGALPDSGSSIIYSWGSKVHFQIHTGSISIERPQYTHTVNDGDIQPGTLTVSWPAGGGTATATDDGLGNLTGQAEGGVNYATGEILIRPTTTPDSGAIITLGYDYAEAGGHLHTESFSGSGDSVNFFLANAPVKPGTVSLTVADILTDSWGEEFTHSVTGTDNGSGGFNRSNTYIAFTGSINYETGEVNIVVAKDTVSGSWIDNEWSQDAPEPFGGTIGATYVDTSTAITPLPGSATFAAGAIEIDLTPTTTKAVVPGSVDFTWSGVRFKDNGAGGIKRESDDLLVGVINYATGVCALDTYAESGYTVTLNTLLTTWGSWTAEDLSFRTPGAPLRPASIYIRATSETGDLVTATSAADGTISGDGVTGTVDYDTGIVSATFTTPIYPQTAHFNCVLYSTMPLDADVLGLDPVRLPVDGRVPVFRDGDVSVIHHTANTELPTGLAAGQTESLGRTRLSHVELTDANGLTIPDGLWTADKVAGTVTMATPLNLSGYIEPLTVTHRIEDMILISDVQVNGQMRSVSQISHDYPAGALVSSAMIVGDLQARAAGVFDQQTWTGEWSDDVVGNATSAEFNDTTYPIAVTNRGAITERWALIFTGTTSFKIIGETVGEIAVGDTSSTIAPANPNTGQPYFSLNPLGWGNGWSTNNVLRFNTVGANHPMWIARTTLQGAAEGDSDSFRIQIRGNANA